MGRPACAVKASRSVSSVGHDVDLRHLRRSQGSAKNSITHPIMISSHIAKDPYTPTPNVYKICVWVAADPPPPPPLPPQSASECPASTPRGRIKSSPAVAAKATKSVSASLYTSCLRRATLAWCAPLSQHSRKLTAKVDVQPVHMRVLTLSNVSLSLREFRLSSTCRVKKMMSS